MIDLARETDIEKLRQAAMVIHTENEHLHARLRMLTARLDKATGKDALSLQREIALLAEQFDRQRRAKFEQSTEKRAAPKADKNQEKDSPQRGHGPTEQASLPVVDVVRELDDADKTCTSCGGALAEMDGQFEESEEIDVVERSFRIVRHRRRKYRCGCGNCIETALAPDKLIAGGRYSIAFAVDVAVSKYLDHLPLARQVRQMERQGLTVTTQTLWDQLWALRGHLLSTYDAMHGYVLSSSVIGADETTWKLMGESKTRTCWVWSVSRSDGVYYRIEPSRSAQAAGKIIGEFAGTIVCDGYSAYSALVKERRAGPAPPVLAHCWAHVRRKFIEAEPHHARAKQAVELIGRLYEVEHDARSGGLGAGELKALRHERSRPVVEQLRRWMLSEAVLPRSGLGLAIGYTDKIWPGLLRFLEDPAVPLDNNQTERGMRGVAVGRKNHYGSRSERGLEVAALFYTLMESAKLCGIDPAKYLHAAATRAIANPGAVTLPKDFGKL